MSLYETLFNQFNITISQLLVTASDFTSAERGKNIQRVLSELISLDIIPILNENDAVSANQGYETFGRPFSDNDSLASLISQQVSADLLVLLTDVEGVFDKAPSEPGAKLIDVFHESIDLSIGEKSLQGRGGMGAKVEAAVRASQAGVPAVIIASGRKEGIVAKILAGEPVGTAFFRNTSPEEATIKDSFGAVVGAGDANGSSADQPMEQAALEARRGGRVLQALDQGVRTQILECLAELLEQREKEVLAANDEDIKAAEASGVQKQLLGRLKLTESKIKTLCKGIRGLANEPDRLGQLVTKTELAEGLVLDQVHCPIGVLLIIFESRPDCLPQIASLAIRSGNGLLLKGGKEALRSCQVLHQVVQDAIHAGSQGQVPRETIGLVTSRADIASLLKLDNCIDLVIPRGSAELVTHIKQNTKIPVLGHAEGVCHVYVDARADEATAKRIIIDAKTDYPSACNAAECLLVHEQVVSSGMVDGLLRGLRGAGVILYGGPRAKELGLVEQSATDMRSEFGDLQLNIEVVSSLDAAIEHINNFSSYHTDCIVTEDATAAQIFLQRIDSACVFHNASTRFADGFRFGLGAEVGISTGRIHARGPVGVEGLLTKKWQLRSSRGQGHTVGDFSSNQCSYTHKKLHI